MAELGEAIRVRSVPAGHSYVRSALGGGPVDGLLATDVASDPVLDDDEPGRWWPHPALDPDWRDPHRPQVVHVHFGYEHRGPAELRALVAAWRADGVRLVVTVHDLHNPHELDPAAHLARTEVLVRAADRVLTLTSSAAEEIARRWSVPAEVVPHPPLVPVGHPARTVARGRDRRRPGRVLAVYPKNGRAGMDLATPLAGLLAHLDAHPEDRAVAHLHPALLEPDHPRAAELRAEPEADGGSGAGGGATAGLLDRWREHPRAELVVRKRADDDTLYDELARTDVVVLPYRAGTHSGWLELCRDLGVATAIPETGHYLAQARETAGPGDRSAHRSYPVGDTAGLTHALGALRAADPRVPDDDEVRARVDAVVAAHRRLYGCLVGGGR